MKFKLKIIVLTVTILLTGTFLYGQHLDSLKTDNKKAFRLSLTHYNHAEQIYDGTWTYFIKENVLEIRRRSFFAKKDSLIFKSKLDSAALTNIKKFNIDSLSDFYFNKCVMITSGTEYYISYTNGAKKKQIHLHHYYHPLVAQIANELNLLIPEEFKISYLSKDTEQDCE